MHVNEKGEPEQDSDRVRTETDDEMTSTEEGSKGRGEKETNTRHAEGPSPSFHGGSKAGAPAEEGGTGGGERGEECRHKSKDEGEREAATAHGRQGQQRPPHSLVPAPVLAVTADQKFRARVNENTLARDPLLAVGHLGRGGGVDLIDTRERNIFFPIGDVQNIVKRLVGLKLPVHKNVWIQTEHLQEEEVTASLKKVALDLVHCPKAKATGCLIDNVEAHFAVNTAPGCHAPKVIQQGYQQRVLAPVLLTPHGSDS